MDEQQKLARLRNAFPVTAERVYFGTGSFGPVSRTFAAARAACLNAELHGGRVASGRYEKTDRARERLRSELAAVVHADPREIALTQSTSDSLAAVLNGFPWQAGDEVVCTQHEHPALLEPLEALARRGKVGLRIAEAPLENAERTEWLARRLTSRTRLVAFAGTAFKIGVRLPIPAITALARDCGAFTLLDGAQSVGAMPLDLAASGIDFCAWPLQKWLCGPEGLGALYVRRDRIDALRADRVTRGWDIFDATAAHLQWLREHAGWDWIAARSLALAAYARRALGRLPQARLLTPESHAGLVTFSITGRDVTALAATLERSGFVFRTLTELGALRISTACFNTEEEIDALIATICADPR